MTQDVTPPARTVDAIAVKAIVTDFVAKVATSQDASDPEVVQRRQAVVDALASFPDEDPVNAPRGIEVLMRAASNLQVALYALNPKKLPFAYRDASDEALSLIDELDALGMDVTGHDVAYDPPSPDDVTDQPASVAPPRMTL